MTYYKVVRQLNEKSISWLYDIPKVLCLTYESGRVTRAMHGTMGVFIFSSLEDARRAARKLTIAKIFKCRPIGTVKKINMALDWHTIPYLESKTLYFDAKKYKRNYRKLEWESCYVVPAIEILEEVK